jgi:hypothetical protein
MKNEPAKAGRKTTGEENEEQEEEEKSKEPEQQGGHKTTGQQLQAKDNIDASEKDTSDKTLEGEMSALAERNEVGIDRWEKAYPTKSGKKVVLPDQATEEEMQPPTQPVEGKLDTKTWKESMPQEAMDEIESMFLSPEEAAQKEAIFNKINKDYIEAQAQKEKHRNSAAEAAASKDKELEEQAQGLERYRKRKDRGKDTAETTEEALLQAVANRKISRKINYDAMSAIFEDGNFSTGSASNQDPFETEMEFGEV